METVTEKIERWKLLSEVFFNEDKCVYIKDLYGNIYFCKIIIIGKEKITVDCFGPKQRAGKREYLYWLNISEFDEYEEREGGSNGRSN